MKKRLLCLKKTLEEARSCETLQKSDECECSEGLRTEVGTNEAEDGPSCYLPHFLVIREDRETTKVRIVFDSAARRNGVSLNDAMFTGPKLQRDVLEILLRFILGPVALEAEIKEMFS